MLCFYTTAEFQFTDIQQSPLDGIKTQAAISDVRSADMGLSYRINTADGIIQPGRFLWLCVMFYFSAVIYYLSNPEGG